MKLALGAWLIAGAGIIAMFVWMATAMRAGRALLLQERGLRLEFEAYATLDARLGSRSGADGPARDLARHACSAVARHSRFGQAALLLRDAEQRLQVVGSSGVDDLMQHALNAWGQRFARDQRLPAAAEPKHKAYTVTVGPMEVFDPTGRSGVIGCRKAMVVPLWSDAGTMLGAVIACPGADDEGALDGETAALEMLAMKLARAVESATLAEKLLRTEKMAGLGQLAQGLAHELNNPLTAVLGFAEMIADTAAAEQVREDANSIIAQAMRMKETVEGLLHFWRPAMQVDRAVDVAGMLRELTARCEAELRSRGVTLLVQMDEGDTDAIVRGSKERLTEVFEKLLNNAAAAVAAKAVAADGAASRNGTGEARAIRLTLARGPRTLQVVVSDTGPGFRDPAKVFDPFYTNRPLGEGQGMSLAVTYGIVREHGGEISAFNLQPHGAAVVVELPLARTVRESGEHALPPVVLA